MDDSALTTVTVAQLPVRIGEVENNRELMRRAVEDAPRGIVVLPELANTGYCFRSLAEAHSLAESLDGPTTRQLTEVARKTGSTIVTSLAVRPEEDVVATALSEEGTGGPSTSGGSVPVGDDAASASNSSAGNDATAATPSSHDHTGETNRLSNVGVVIEGSGIVGSYRKVHLWGGEPQFFTPGDKSPAMIATQFGRLALMVCYDLEFPEWTRMAALAGADLIVAPVNWPLDERPAGQRAIEQVVVQSAARTSKVAIAVSDRTGAERLNEPQGSDWVGGSIIVGADGYPRTEPIYGQPGSLSAELDLFASRDKALGPHNDVLRDRRPELYVFD